MEHYRITELPDARRIRWVFDEDYRSEGSFALDTEEETTAAVRAEEQAFERGDLMALGAIVERKCSHCGQWEQVDSLWGIVVDSRADLAQEAMSLGLVG